MFFSYFVENCHASRNDHHQQQHSVCFLHVRFLCKYITNALKNRKLRPVRPHPPPPSPSCFRYTLGVAISVALAPLVALAFILNKHTALGYIHISIDFVMLVVGVTWLRARRDKSLAREFPAYGGEGGKKGRRVAVVGGGCAGVVACKEMVDEGHTVND